MGLPLVIATALAQGATLRFLQRLGEEDYGFLSQLTFLLPAQALTVGVPLTFYLLRNRLAADALASRLVAVALALTATGAWVGWVNAPVEGARPHVAGSLLLYTTLALLGWFVALPFLSVGLRGTMRVEGYTALFDEAWRLAITLVFAMLFVGLFWLLLAMFVALFDSIGVGWPRDLLFTRNFVFPATCAAAGFGIALSDVRPEMFRALRRLLLALLRWLTALAAAIVLLFLGALAVEGVEPLWKTGYATGGLVAISLALIVLYNAIYQDGRESHALPRPFSWIVRAALVLGPALALLAFWALGLRIGQYGLSEDRLHALLVVAILSGHLVGYSIVSLAGARAPFEIRHVNVVMALAIVASLLAIHTPLVDFKRIAVATHLARHAKGHGNLDPRYLRNDSGRYGIAALQRLAASDSPDAEVARRALAEANRSYDVLSRGVDAPGDRARLLARIEVFPRGQRLPDDLVDHLFTLYRDDAGGRRLLPCVDRGAPCSALMIDLDGDSADEAIVDAAADQVVYARRGGRWARIGRLQSWQYGNPEEARQALARGESKAVAPPRESGVEIGTRKFHFIPEDCPPSTPRC